MMRSTSGRWICGSLVVLLCLTLAGCSGRTARAKVKGQVKFGNRNLTAGTVAFMTKEGQIGSGNIDANGNYEVATAPVGDVTITVTVPKMMGMGPGMRGAPKPPGNMAPMQPPEGGGAGAAAPIDPSKIVPVPDKYANAETSPLKFKVEKGEQTHDITLEP